MRRLTTSKNPALSKNIFYKESLKRERTAAEVMTINGTVNKAILMFVLLMIGAFYTWKIAMPIETGASVVTKWMLIGGIGGFITALVTIFKKDWAHVSAPVYAVFEGLFLGAISAFFEAQFPGIVMQAVALTFGTLFILLAAYKSGFIKVTKKFRTGVIIATGAVAVVYLLSFVLSMFNVQVTLFQPTTLGIIISLVIVVIAALNLVLDFDMIYQGAQQKAPKQMEWYAAFGLMVTLIWLYIEILRLLALLASRD